MVFFFFKQKTAYEMRISDWSSDVCSSDLAAPAVPDIGDYAEHQHRQDNRVGRMERRLDARVAVPFVAERHADPGGPEAPRPRTAEGLAAEFVKRLPRDSSRKSTRELPSLMHISYAELWLIMTNEVTIGNT